MQTLIWIPIASMALDPYSNGQWVAATPENMAESKKRWEEHDQEYLKLAKNNPAKTQTLKSKNIRRN